MNVTGFLPAKKETDSAEPMDTGSHAGPLADLRFDLAHRAETRREEKAG